MAIQFTMPSFDETANVYQIFTRLKPLQKKYIGVVFYFTLLLKNFETIIEYHKRGSFYMLHRCLKLHSFTG